jgi:hypothetical protein
MNTMKRVCGVLLAGAVLVVPAAVQAEILEVAPTKAVVLPADESGLTKVLLQFDLSGLQEGSGRVVDEALLDWSVAGVPSEEMSEYAAYQVTSAWTEQGVGSGSLPSVGEGAVTNWEFTPADYDANDGGFLRFNLKGLTRDWAAGTSANYGVMVVTDAVSRATLSSQMENARLTVRYGFRPE